MRSLDHPNILAMLEVYDEPDYHIIITEIASGGELFDRIVERRHYNEEDARDVVATVAKALFYCHRKGIVHRDLKPENILLSTTAEDAIIKIADFGFAKPVSAEGLMTDCGRFVAYLLSMQYCVNFLCV